MEQPVVVLSEGVGGMKISVSKEWRFTPLTHTDLEFSPLSYNFMDAVGEP